MTKTCGREIRNTTRIHTNVQDLGCFSVNSVAIASLSKLTLLLGNLLLLLLSDIEIK